MNCWILRKTNGALVVSSFKLVEIDSWQIFPELLHLFLAVPHFVGLDEKIDEGCGDDQNEDDGEDGVPEENAVGRYEVEQ